MANGRRLYSHCTQSIEANTQLVQNLPVLPQYLNAAHKAKIDEYHMEHALTAKVIFPFHFNGNGLKARIKLSK
jgi:hypothetical protein